MAFDAGNDILCFAEHVKQGIEKIVNNATPKQIEDSFQRIWKLKEKAFENEVPSSHLKPEIDNTLNRKIAENSLTLFKGTNDSIAKFRTTDFCTLTIKRFLKNEPSEEILKSLLETKAEVSEEKDILILLTPPQIKPANNFGFLQEEINFINELIQTKNVVLYLFGNPYMLNHLNVTKALAVVLVYQNFTEFQDLATEHFLGKLEAKGSLPVTIKS